MRLLLVAAGLFFATSLVALANGSESGSGGNPGAEIQNDADMQTAAAIALSAGELSRIKRGLDEIERLNTLMKECKAALDEVTADGKLDDASTPKAEKCGVAPSPQQSLKDLVQGLLVNLRRLAAELGVKAGELEQGLPTESDELNQEEAGKSGTFRYFSDNNLRIVSVSAGDHRLGHTCEGNEPRQRLVTACFGQKTETPASSGKFVVSWSAASEADYCHIESGVSPAALCGYDPSPQGLKSIRIRYMCGNEPNLFVTRNGQISIYCDPSKKFTSGFQ